MTKKESKAKKRGDLTARRLVTVKIRNIYDETWPKSFQFSTSLPEDNSFDPKLFACQVANLCCMHSNRATKATDGLAVQVEAPTIEFASCLFEAVWEELSRHGVRSPSRRYEVALVRSSYDLL